MIHVDQIYQLTNGSSYCEPFKDSPFVLHDYECPCAHSTANQTIMAQNVDLYNQELQSVYYTYKAMNFPTFAVAYQPLPVDIMSFPITAISNIGMCNSKSSLPQNISLIQSSITRLLSSIVDCTSMAGEDGLVCPDSLMLTRCKY
jgi:hypothetical protein